jgi:hypothetical protein
VNWQCGLLGSTRLPTHIRACCARARGSFGNSDFMSDVIAQLRSISLKLIACSRLIHELVISIGILDGRRRLRMERNVRELHRFAIFDFYGFPFRADLLSANIYSNRRCLDWNAISLIPFLLTRTGQIGPVHSLTAEAKSCFSPRSWRSSFSQARELLP